MPYDNLKKALQNKNDLADSYDENSEVVAPEAVKSDELPSSMDPMVAEQAKQDMVERDAERNRLGVHNPFQNLAEALRQPASGPTPHVSWEHPNNAPEMPDYEKQLLAEKLKEQDQMTGKQTGGALVEQIAQSRAEEEAAKLSKLQQLMKGGTPGTMDQVNQNK